MDLWFWPETLQKVEMDEEKARIFLLSRVLYCSDTFFDELNPMRREVKLFKEVEKKVLTNTIKCFAHINFDGNHTMLFIFGRSDDIGEFLGHDNVVLATSTMHKTILKRRQKRVQVWFKTIDKNF
ncbi:hypothetical protein LIER_13917 [Lithospermum erythrorhizon]|uniref:Uncharacterized protein n=1 Tax=Lithospermum erythrorhizon TaxID=34254 RepID=A0AAV3PZN2_LITER